MSQSKRPEYERKRLASTKRIQHKVRLFLSVDVNDSTALKTESQASHGFPNWVTTFRTFYRRYPEDLAKGCLAEDVEVPKLWKCLGDEMVFCTILRDAEQAVRALSAFRNATNSFQKPESKIRLKNTAWIADFPVGSVEVQVSDQSQNGKNRTDFLGPQMDLGFRLSHRSSVRRFVISVDLALLVFDSVNKLKVFYEGREVLKGVLGDRPYPILWIDMSEQTTGLEDRLRGSNPDPHDLKTFCEQFIGETADLVSRPFLKGARNFDQEPQGWKKKFEDACRLLLAEEDTPLPEAKNDGVKPTEGEIATVVKATSELLSPPVADER